MMRLLALIATGGAVGVAEAGQVAREFNYLDLQPYANQKLTDNLGSGREGNNLAALPKGEQTFEGVRFKIADGFIQLGSKLLTEERPDKVTGLKVGQKLAKLHFLHATGYGNGMTVGEEGKEGDPLFVPDGTQIAAYKVHYADGNTATIAVVYGKDVRDWWFTEKSKGVTRGKVAWRGENELGKGFGSKIRLYLGTWENPHPDKRVVSIDYEKRGDTQAAPFCVAITLERK
jgi:hypothetical protein